MTTVLDDYKQYVADVVKSQGFKNWHRDNPGEFDKWGVMNTALLAGSRLSTLPSLTTPFGKSLVDAAREYVDSLPPIPPPPPPSPTGVSKVGLYQLAGTLSLCSHLNDGTYEVIVGDWDETDILQKSTAKGLAYTVTGATTNDTQYTVLTDQNWQQFVQTLISYQAQHGHDGYMLDNCIPQYGGVHVINALTVNQVADALHAKGIMFAVNAGNYIAGNPDSDTGKTWMDWVAQLTEPDYCLLENWMEFAGGSLLGNLRGTQNGGNYDGWRRCPAAAGAKFMPCTYGPPTPGTVAMAAEYGRAAMLTAPGVSPDAVYVYSTEGRDPYDATWTKKDPNPSIDPVALKASL